MKKIFYVGNFEAPYRVPFYNLLAERYDITMAFSETQEEQVGRDKRWFQNGERKYQVVNLQCKKLFGKKVFFNLKELVRDCDMVFMDMYGSPANMYAIHKLKKYKIPFVLSVDGMLHREKEGFFLKQLKKYLLAQPQMILSPSEYVDGCLKEYGVAEEKLYRYGFTSLTAEDIALAKELATTKKAEIKKQLGITESKMVLSVGQFIHRKGFDTLLEAWKSLGNDTGLYIVGGNPTDEYLQIKEKLGLKNVHFEGFKMKQELALYFAAADVFVLPTREDIWGLVINEAMSYALPIITTDRCAAGLELVRGDNGYIISVDDVADLNRCLLELVNDDDKRHAYGNVSLERIAEYSVENMAKRHIELFEKVLSER